jgi:hypothetical protein
MLSSSFFFLLNRLEALVESVNPILRTVSRTPSSIIAFVLPVLCATVRPITHTVAAAFPELLTVLHAVHSVLPPVSAAVLT